jgi:sialidase-1
MTTPGSLLAFCAARKEASDWAHIDIAMRRSSDGGRTWEPPRIVASECGSTVDNPVPIVDRMSGAVHFLYQVNYERCYYMRSDDDGVTFSEPTDITGAFEQFRADYAWTVIAPGPGHGIQMRNGRLVVPVWLSDGTGAEFGPGKRGHRPSVVSVIFSDDHGQTWQRGDIVVRHSSRVPNPSETVALQVSDGRVMLNIRNESTRYSRLVAYSDDGATGWSEPEFNDGLFDPICFGSLARLTEQPASSKNRILFANPDSAGNPATVRNLFRRRENLTIKLSYDEGQTWPVAKVLDPGVAGYSDMAVGPDGVVYCLYEGGDTGGSMFDNAHLTIARFNLEWLTDGKDSLEEG